MGAGVSCLVALRGAANLPAMALLWALYHSIVNVGQTWYAFGEKRIWRGVLRSTTCLEFDFARKITNKDIPWHMSSHVSVRPLYASTADMVIGYACMFCEFLVLWSFHTTQKRHFLRKILLLASEETHKSIGVVAKGLDQAASSTHRVLATRF